MNAQVRVLDALEWLGDLDQPLIISGPCSAETEEQVISTARKLKQSGKVHAYRAGVWKPRTRPNSFEGVGEKAFPWLKKVKQEIGLPVTIEVANAKHVELALKNEIDILWIGARTTVNPFSVQEIADALKGVDIPVMVKNPINPDLALWIGAFERLNQVGIEKLVAIHRGFSSVNKEYRNAPNWQIPIELKTELPNIPLICDPSHISGDRNKVELIAQKSLDLDFDGLMIESHIDPDKAWSDSKQQITPDKLGEILTDLKFRYQTSDCIEFQSQLEKIRSEIDELDTEFIHLLAKRFDLSTQLGSYKKENNVTIFQLERWKQILNSRIAEAETNNIDSEFMESIIKLIHDESIRLQTQVFQ